MGHREAMDPILRDVLGDADDTPVRETPRDVVGDLIFRQTYGFDSPGSRPTPKTVAEISKSLENIRQEIGARGPYAERFQKLGFDLAQMAASAEACDPGSLATEFLQAAAAGSDAGMKSAIRKMLQAPDIN